MSFLTPLAFIGGLIAIPIILMYMLRLRRREVIVSSNFLWQQILQDNEANTPWQRLRRNILLILQLIILALLVFTLARPFIVVPTVSAGKTVLLLDATASMNATDEDGRTRFVAAQEEALRIVSQMGPADTMSVIRVADIAEPLTPYTDDVMELSAAIRAAEPSYAQGDWETALILAAAGQEGADIFNVLIIGDGGLGDSTTLPQNIPEPIFIPVGQSADNIAITALAVAQEPGKPPQLFASITNYGTVDAEVSLVIKLDGVASISRTITVTARSEQSLIFAIDQPFTTIEAEMIVRDETVNDYLGYDNHAWTVAGGTGTRRVLVMSDENIFLDRVLRSMPGIQVFTGDINSVSLPAREFDLYIFNGWLPAQLPNADMFIINPPRNTPLFRVGEEIADVGNPVIVGRDDPRMAFITFDSVNIRVFRPVTAEWANTLIRADGGPLLLAGENDGRQIAILTFDIRDSDLPLQVTWPVMMSNLIDWFTPAAMVRAAGVLSVGDSLEFRPPIEADALQVIMPDGTSRDFSIEGTSVAFAETQLPGLYEVDALSGSEVVQSEFFPINVFGTGESDITPQTTINIGGGVIETDTEDQLGQREFWPLVALLALLLLTIEWYVYHKRLQVPTIMTPVRRRATS